MYGLAKRRGKTRADFDPRELARGVRVEMEHTRSRREAEQIAMDHLTEDPRYYTKLRRAGLRDEHRPRALRPTAVWSSAEGVWRVYWGSKRLPRTFATRAEADRYAQLLVNPVARTGSRDRSRDRSRARRRR